MTKIVYVESTSTVFEVSTTPATVVTITGVAHAGPPGSVGVGVPEGGTAAQVLAKASGTDYDTEWVDPSAGGGGAPTTADYLVGTTQGGLSAEIVVGATPGGELGGTWASPTVDASHSGSTHAATQAAAEATASAALAAHTGDTTDAHDASAISFTPNGSIAATDVQTAIQEVRDEAGGSSDPLDANVQIANRIFAR